LSKKTINVSSIQKLSDLNAFLPLLLGEPTFYVYKSNYVNTRKITINKSYGKSGVNCYSAIALKEIKSVITPMFSRL